MGALKTTPTNLCLGETLDAPRVNPVLVLYEFITDDTALMNGRLFLKLMHPLVNTITVVCAGRTAGNFAVL